MAVVVPHTHWDREWYAPFETLRFHLVRFLDELVETLEDDQDLPVFLLDGQAVILEDYLEVRPSQRDRVTALVRAGRLRPGPFYVQPDEFHVAGESVVRNLLTGIRVATEFGWVMREGYLPDTFGHVDQLPQILRGFDIDTFYAMRGFGHDVVDDPQSQFWWRAPDGSRVLAEWLTESYSNAAVLTPDAAGTALHHGILVRYDSLPELLERLQRRSPSGAMLLLNGGDHLRIQQELPGTVASLDADVPVDLRLGGLEEFHALVASRPLPDRTVEGELRFGGRHDVFTGIGSTRTPMKRDHDRVESQLLHAAERLDALAYVLLGRTHLDSLRYAWRELLKNHAHDSICGCSVDQVHREVAMRLAKVGQVAAAVEQDALEAVAHAVAPELAQDGVPVVVVNPSAFPRSAVVDVAVLPDLDAPTGERRFGWSQGEGVDFTGYALLDERGRSVPFTVRAGAETAVVDPLDRRKELLRDRITFLAADVPALGTSGYRLVPRDEAAAAEAGRPAAAGANGHAAGSAGSAGSAPGSAGGAGSAGGYGQAPGVSEAAGEPRWEPVCPGRDRLDNGVLRVEAARDGTLTLTHLPSGAARSGLLEVLDDGDRGDEYGFGPVAGDAPISSTAGRWEADTGATEGTLRLRTVLTVPAALTGDRTARAAGTVDLPVGVTARLAPGSDTLDVLVTVTNTALDHRLRVRFPDLAVTGTTTAETAFGVVERGPVRQSGADAWHEPPSGAVALRRFVLGRDRAGESGLQVLTEGLHEYTTDPTGALDITLLRAVGWLARTDHPRRPHKVGPEVATPEAQCLGEHAFRFALHPLGPCDGPGHWYRVAEEFSAPLRACAVQGRRRGDAVPRDPDPHGAAGPRGGGAVGPVRSVGLEVAPAEAVLSAFKTAEDRDGVVVRVFNSADHPVTATLTTGCDLDGAELCNLEERARAPLAVERYRVVSLPLAPHQIATVWLRPAREGGR